MIFSFRRMFAVARKELRHLARDKRMRPVIFVVPVIQLVLLGLAANLDVVDVPTVVVDHDHTPLSREIAGRIDATAAFQVVAVTDDEHRAEASIDNGTAEVVVVVPPHAQRDLARLDPVPIPVWIDGTDTNRGLLAQSYLEQVLAQESADRLAGAVPLALPPHPDLRVRVLYNPALESQWFMLPALVVMVLTIITMLLSAIAIVKERENGTIEQLVVTPIKSSELVIGKLLPFVGVGAIVATFVTLAAIFVFGLPFRGNPLVLVGMSLVFIMSTLGFGLLASTVSQTQQQAMLSAFLILMPSFLLGGVFYPITNMPTWAQRIADISPVRYFVVMARAVFLKGVGFGPFAWEMSMLAGLGVIVLTIAMLRFRKRSA